jgi:hypothetical protein
METRTHFGQREEIPLAVFPQVRPNNSKQADKPTILLWLGVITVPFVFGWLLLARRYSWGTRLFGFSWGTFATAFVLLGMVLNSQPPESAAIVKQDIQSPQTPENVAIKQDTQPSQPVTVPDDPPTTYDMNQIDMERRQNCLRNPNSLGHWFMCSDVPDQPQTVIVIVPPDED